MSTHSMIYQNIYSFWQKDRDALCPEIQGAKTSPDYMKNQKKKKVGVCVRGRGCQIYSIILY